MGNVFLYQPYYFHTPNPECDSDSGKDPIQLLGAQMEKIQNVVLYVYYGVIYWLMFWNYFL